MQDISLNQRRRSESGDLPLANWLYKLKFDGYRALAFKAGKEVRLVSRSRTNFDNAYPQLIDALKLLTAKKRCHRRRDRCPRPKGKIFFPAPSIVRNR
jgi:ATP-dependent DNA ligase